MALLLELCHHVGEHSRSVKAGDWSRCPDFCYWNWPLIELAGKTFGVIGYGRIGQATARLAAAFGMKVVAFDSFVQDGGLAEMVSLEELLARSDVISLHCPLTPQTQNIIHRGSIARMKDGVLLLNTSRGPARQRGGPGGGACLRQGGRRGAGRCWRWSRRSRTTRSWPCPTA